MLVYVISLLHAEVRNNALYELPVHPCVCFKIRKIFDPCYDFPIMLRANKRYFHKNCRLILFLLSFSHNNAVLFVCVCVCVYIYIYIYIYMILKCTQCILYSKCTDPAVATSCLTNCNLMDQLQLDVNQLQLDGPIATQCEPIATRRVPVATKRLTDCNCDITLIATRRN
jgi:hypothetical protein